MPWSSCRKRRGSSRTTAKSHYQLGLALARAGRRDEATPELQKGRDLIAASDRSQNASLDLTEGRAALAKGDLPLAEAKFQRAIRLGPASAEAQALLGTVLERQGDSRGALSAYRKALDLNPSEPTAQQGLDRLTKISISVEDDSQIGSFEEAIRQGKFKDVEPLLAQYVTDHPTSSWGWYALGYSQFAQQKIGDAIRSLAKSLELDITNAEAHKILGRSLMIIGRFDAAEVEFEQGLRYKPDSAELHYNLGKLHSIQDNWEPARKQFEAALEIDPSYVEALDALGLAMEALGHDQEAVADYQKAVELNDRTPWHLRLGAREPQCLLQSHRRPRQGAGLRAAGAGARPGIRSRAVPEGTRRRTPGPVAGRGGRPDSRDRDQPSRIVLLLRARGRLPTSGPDGRKQESARHLQAPGSRVGRARQTSARPGRGRDACHSVGTAA